MSLPASPNTTYSNLPLHWFTTGYFGHLSFEAIKCTEHTATKIKYEKDMKYVKDDLILIQSGYSTLRK